MTEQQARSLVATVATLMAAALAALAWGDRAVLVALTLAVLWLLYDRGAVHDRTGQALDEAEDRP